MAVVLLFDIDGTLVTSGGVARQALVSGACQVLGDDAPAAERVRAAFDFGYGGMTDRAIVRRGLRQLGVAPSGESAGASERWAAGEAIIDAVLAAYLPRLRAALAGTPSPLRLLPGAADLVAFARGLPGVVVGLGTGNVREGARAKLDPFGLYEAMPFGGFGCDAEAREDLIGAGFRRGAERLGVPTRAAGLVIVGDTERDIDAARAHGGLTLGVATGSVDADALRRHGAEEVAERLDGPAVRAQLTALVARARRA